MRVIEIISLFLDNNEFPGITTLICDKRLIEEWNAKIKSLNAFVPNTNAVGNRITVTLLDQQIYLKIFQIFYSKHIQYWQGSFPKKKRIIKLLNNFKSDTSY